MMIKKQVDWEAVEGGYPAGVLSLRQIAIKHGISDTAVRKHAKAHGWERDLSQRVRDKVRADLVRAEVRARTPDEQVRTERQIIEAAAATVVEVIRGHRTSLARARSVVETLQAQLQDVIGSRDDIRKAVVDLVDDGRRRDAMMRAVSIGENVTTVRDLTQAIKNLIALERQAFGMSDTNNPESSPARDHEGEHMARALADIDSLVARLDAIVEA